MIWKRLLTYITGSVEQELLLRNEYLATENRILKNQIKGRLRLTDPERIGLAQVGKRLGTTCQFFRTEIALIISQNPIQAVAAGAGRRSSIVVNHRRIDIVDRSASADNPRLQTESNTRSFTLLSHRV